jgi:hypothetical protein
VERCSDDVGVVRTANRDKRDTVGHGPQPLGLVFFQVACTRSRIDALDDPLDPAADHGTVVITEVITQVGIGIGIGCLCGRWGKTIRSIAIWLMLCTTMFDKPGQKSLKALLEGVSPSAIDGQAHAKEENLCHGLISMLSDQRGRFSSPERSGRSAGQGYERVQLGHAATIEWKQEVVNDVSKVEEVRPAEQLNLLQQFLQL